MSLGAHLQPSRSFPSVPYLKFYGLKPFQHPTNLIFTSIRLQFQFSNEPRSSSSICDSSTNLIPNKYESQNPFKFSMTFIWINSESSAHEPASSFMISRFFNKFYFERIMSLRAHSHSFWFDSAYSKHFVNEPENPFFISGFIHKFRFK